MIKKTTFTASYKPYDDVFSENENIHQVLFTPGSNVYHSDLNLIQTILQDQIALFGSYFLTPDSFVSGGQFKINATHSFLYYSNQFNIKRGDYLKDPKNKNIFKVVATQKNVEEGIDCFCYEIIENRAMLSGEFFLHPFNPDTGEMNTSIRYDIISNSFSSYIHFTESVIFIEGFFVYCPEQIKILDYRSATPTCSVGFTVNKSIVLSDEDLSLLDNAIESSSFQSPGSDRYQILAELTIFPLIENDSFLDVTVKGSFLEYLRIKNGTVIKDVRLSVLSEFEKTLARRTFDTSGSYTVRPFKIKIEDYSPEFFVIKISPGKAYVKGHEIEYLTTSEVLLPRLSDDTKFRYDKLIINSTGQFSLIRGVEYSKPILPKDNPDCLVLYKLLFKPGSTSSSLIGIKYINNKRYTMRDIGKIENRIENMEYYIALSLLEKQTQDQLILDGEGNNRFKNGFMVDNFKTYNSVDLYSRDNKFSFDLEKGHLRPQFEMMNLGLKFNRLESSGVVINGQLITLPFSEVVMIQQPFASTMVNVSPYDVFTWEGKITLYPQNDFWVDTQSKPDLLVKQYGNEDVWSALGENGFRYEWGSWDTKILNTLTSGTDVNTTSSFVKTSQRLWNPKVDSSVDKELLDTYFVWIRSGFLDGFKKQPDGYVEGDPAIYLQYNNQGIQPNITSEIVSRSLGSSVKTIELSPFIRPQKIAFKGEGFKPNTILYAFFSDKDATNWCTQNDNSFGVLKTDSEGDIEGYFYLPEKTFNIGTHNFKLTDDHTETAQQTTTYGIAQFHAKGMNQTVQETFISTREAELLTTGIDHEVILSAEDRSKIVPPTPTPTVTPTISITPTKTITPTPTLSRIKKSVYKPQQVVTIGQTTGGMSTITAYPVPSSPSFVVTPSTSSFNMPCEFLFNMPGDWWYNTIESTTREIMERKYLGLGLSRSAMTQDDIMRTFSAARPLTISNSARGVTNILTYNFENGFTVKIYQCVPPSGLCGYFYQLTGSLNLPTPTPTTTSRSSCVVEYRNRSYWENVCKFTQGSFSVSQYQSMLSSSGAQPLPESIATSNVMDYNLNGVVYDYGQSSLYNNQLVTVKIYRCMSPSNLCGYFYKVF